MENYDFLSEFYTPSIVLVNSYCSNDMCGPSRQLKESGNLTRATRQPNTALTVTGAHENDTDGILIFLLNCQRQLFPDNEKR